MTFWKQVLKTLYQQRVEPIFLRVFASFPCISLADHNEPSRTLATFFVSGDQLKSFYGVTRVE
jgi:hypothetical protein